jgi:hypothetical protein
MSQHPDLAAFLDSGVSMLGGAANEDLIPEAFRVWGASVDDGRRIRALISSDAGQTLASVRVGTAICLNFSDPLTFRSIQVKGRAVESASPPGPADVDCMRRYGETFGATAVQRGIPPALLESTRPLTVFAVTIEIGELYDQTPGPTAGIRLADGG